MSEAFSVRIKHNGKWSSWSTPEVEEVEFVSGGLGVLNIKLGQNGEQKCFDVTMAEGEMLIEAAYDSKIKIS